MTSGGPGGAGREGDARYGEQQCSLYPLVAEQLMMPPARQSCKGLLPGSGAEAKLLMAGGPTMSDR